MVDRRLAHQLDLCRIYETRSEPVSWSTWVRPSVGLTGCFTAPRNQSVYKIIETDWGTMTLACPSNQLKSRGLHSIMWGHLKPLGAPQVITQTVKQSRAGRLPHAACDTQRSIVAVRPVPGFAADTCSGLLQNATSAELRFVL